MILHRTQSHLKSSYYSSSSITGALSKFYCVIKKSWKYSLSYLKLHYGSVTSFRRNETWESGRGTELQYWCDSSTAGNCATASKHQNPSVSSVLSNGQSISEDTANLAYLLAGLLNFFWPLNTRPIICAYCCTAFCCLQVSLLPVKQNRGQRKPGRGSSPKLAGLWCILTFSY